MSHITKYSKHYTMLQTQMYNYIVSSVNLSNYKYKIIDSLDEINTLMLKSNEFCIGQNFIGTNCLLVFIKLQGVYHSFIVDKKNIINRHAQTQSSDFVKTSIQLPSEIYNGTIFDGYAITAKNPNFMNKFVICDMYQFCSKSTINVSMTSKLGQLKDYLNKFYNKTDKLNTIELVLNKTLPLTNANLESMLQNPEFHSKGIYCINEISFKTHKLILFAIPKIPPMSIQQIAQTYSQTSSPRIAKSHSSVSSPIIANAALRASSSADMIKQKSTFEREHVIDITQLKNKQKMIFLMKKTKTVDVYNLYLLREQNGDKKYVKIGIGMISTIKKSLMFQDLFKTAECLNVKCKYDSESNKWIPCKKTKKEVTLYPHFI